MHPLKIGLKKFVVVYYLGLQIVIVALAGIIRGGSLIAWTLNWGLTNNFWAINLSCRYRILRLL